MSDVLVHIFRDLNKAPLPDHQNDEERLLKNIEQALRSFNGRYRVAGITACGESKFFLPIKTAVNKLAYERYCLCDIYTKKINTENGWLRGIDKQRWMDKDETPDLMLERLMYKMARCKLPSTPTVFLLVSRDDAFRATMMDLKRRKGKTVLLALSPLKPNPKNSGCQVCCSLSSSAKSSKLRTLRNPSSNFLRKCRVPFSQKLSQEASFDLTHQKQNVH